MNCFRNGDLASSSDGQMEKPITPSASLRTVTCAASTRKNRINPTPPGISSPSSVDSRERLPCVRSIGKRDGPVHRPCRRCSIHGDMDRVRVAVSIDSGIPSPQPSLSRTGDAGQAWMGRWDISSARLLWGALSKSPAGPSRYDLKRLKICARERTPKLPKFNSRGFEYRRRRRSKMGASARQ